MKAPCMDCPDVGCGVYHDICPKYQEFKKNQQESYKRRILISETESTLNKRQYTRKKRFEQSSPRKQR